MTTLSISLRVEVFSKQRGALAPPRTANIIEKGGKIMPASGSCLTNGTISGSSPFGPIIIMDWPLIVMRLDDNMDGAAPDISTSASMRNSNLLSAPHASLVSSSVTS
eukprot:CAMPEP_0197733070 /NCGR_PEP_ID=MMETSP1434-20131217/42738_1 /TAXON_ID=265543 /ORGANISM="Minutocellus polymorphus, Strain CCMP3303" /LENGTH=106 /DNA_ID=CAMNT_0043320377 /DNA_START=65 /DNA_END=385 /DNA_ORIENTATION=+